ncbi:FHA domain-containing protein [Acidimicrobiaceae bacterium]|nr:FHA domain-containing protein [Acidimicrobiaceae bacterium]
MNNDTVPFEDSIFINQEAKYILSLLNDETKSSSWLLTNGIHKIGRLETKEIILDDVTVSRNHAFISVEDETVIITDEKSTNGIFVNGELTDESVLTSGSRIQIGKFSLIITKVDKK